MNAERGDYLPYESDLGVPDVVGVPVATLLGAYDPDTLQAVIYPVFHGNYGNVFDPEAPDFEGTDDACWLDVEHADGTHTLIALSPTRHRPNSANQFHVNLPAEARPAHATLACRTQEHENILDDRAFETNTPTLPPVAIVGEEYGVWQLQERELREIEAAVESLTPEDAATIDFETAMKIEGMASELLQEHLNAHAWDVVQAYLQLQISAQNIEAVIQYGLAHELPEDAFRSMVLKQLTASAFADDASDINVVGAPFHIGESAILSTLDDNGFLQTQDTENIEDADLWVFDVQGKIHPLDAPWLCLTPSSGRLTLDPCSTTQAAQRWILESEPHVLKNQSTQQCVDFDRANHRMIMYGCHGNWNQQWVLDAKYIQPWLALLPPDTLQPLVTLLRP